MPQLRHASTRSTLRSLICLPTSTGGSRRERRRKSGFWSDSSSGSGPSGGSRASTGGFPRPTPTVTAAMPSPVPPPPPAAAAKRDRDQIDGEAEEECGSGEPQIIPMAGTNEWALLGVLEDTFEPNKFKVEMRSGSYKVWAPRRLDTQELARCSGVRRAM